MARRHRANQECRFARRDRFSRGSATGRAAYLGDAHAVQGDGELNGNALETSMDIEFSVDMVRDKEIGSPRLENGEYLVAVGLAR